MWHCGSNDLIRVTGLLVGSISFPTVFSILTTETNDLMRPLHDRMPVILDPTADALWLDPGADTSTLHALLMPYSGGKMEAYPVDAWVNGPKHEGPRCLETLAPETTHGVGQRALE